MQVYKAEIVADEDAYIENNTLHAITNVKGIPKVLLVEEQSEFVSGDFKGKWF